jgi:hypothetical protein
VVVFHSYSVVVSFLAFEVQDEVSDDSVAVNFVADCVDLPGGIGQRWNKYLRKTLPYDPSGASEVLEVVLPFQCLAYHTMGTLVVWGFGSFPSF